LSLTPRLLLLVHDLFLGEAIIACGLDEDHSLFLFLVSSLSWRMGGKEETMYVHGDGIVDNDYNAAFDSFGHRNCLL
jgi:hypothetical protein